MALDGKRPKLRTLEAFEAVSRHLSISKAAEELGVTQSAISHQLKQLREELGESLVHRSGRGVALTEMGKRLAGRIQEAFGQIDRSVADVLGSGHRRIRIAICSSFAPGWLIGRLANFYAANPDIDLHLQMYAKDPELTDVVGDAFVTTLPDQQLGYFALKIMDERLVAIFATSKANALRSLPLITTDLEPGRIGADWKAFRRLADVPDFDTDGRWLFASHYVMAFNMVEAGLGIA
ncbi:LysR family transcriptional regulator, partial [Mesorhizobium marinum]|uniref:LysR family transcriptional regulator n=1 Tax=Mesorhizobium marinum TaxID=3228790 RepID=UPI003465D46F